MVKMPWDENMPPESGGQTPERAAAPPGSPEAQCVAKFGEWWSPQEMRGILAEINPGVAGMLRDGGRVAEILYDVVGPTFLRDMNGSTSQRRAFLEKILQAAIKTGRIREEDLVQAARKNSGSREIGIKDVAAMSATSRWCAHLADLLGLPRSAAAKTSAEHTKPIETVEPRAAINPLYDYQYSVGMFVRKMLEGRGDAVKRQMLSLPTGAGKTRMLVQTVIEWINDGKPSCNTQQSESKFVLWIAQSEELCEQALSAFKTVFESMGKPGTTLKLHRVWGKGGTLPDTEMPDILADSGVIVATINTLHKVWRSEPGQLESLAELTSCIIVDEAHHVVADSYSQVLRKMGFNWDNRKKEISERGIVLLGLTATPFRGGGRGEDTERLKRWMGEPYHPRVDYPDGIPNAPPHALIDCQTAAYAGEPVRIMGERSYDRDGSITEYSWSIEPEATVVDVYGKNRPEPHVSDRPNLHHVFKEPGTYAITLRVTDNEGDSGEARALIRVSEPPADPDHADAQKAMYGKLMRRGILCYVYHQTLQSGETIEIKHDDREFMSKFKEFAKGTLRSIEKLESRNRMIIDNIRDLIEGGRKKVLFFGCSLEHSRQISILLKAVHGISSGYVDSKTGADARVDAIGRFKDGDLQVLCNFNVLTAGFDAPKTDCVFVGRPVGSTQMYTQMIGRGMRGPKNGGTPDVLIVDIDDNYQLYDDSPVPLGWKTFSDYWKEWKGEPSGGVSRGPDQGARDALYDDYFELCKKAGRRIRVEDLGRGRHSRSEYATHFGSAERFCSEAGYIADSAGQLDPGIGKVQLRHDYDRMRQLLGRHPHFEEVVKMSAVGAQYYVGLCGSLGQFKRDLDP